MICVGFVVGFAIGAVPLVMAHTWRERVMVLGFCVGCGVVVGALVWLAS